MGDDNDVLVEEDASQMAAPSSLRFSVKIINPRTQGGFTVYKWETENQHDEVDALKNELFEKLEEQGYVSTQDDFKFGFMVPGHGVKGKQLAIDIDEDVSRMYQQYRGRKEIVLWVKIQSKTKKQPIKGTCGQKRLSVSEDGSNAKSPPIKKAKKDTLPQKGGPNYGKHLQKMSELDDIVEELNAKHQDSGKYTAEQIRVWAHMLQMQKHDSYVYPPAKRFFKSGKDAPKVQEGLSPAKRLNMRTECIDQLDKWHSLMERGAITAEQYKEYQDTILADMKF